MNNYQHIIETNGEAFRIKTKVAAKWEVEREWSNPRSIVLVRQDVTFSTHADAVKWIRREYGDRARIAPRPWRPA